MPTTSGELNTMKITITPAPAKPIMEQRIYADEHLIGIIKTVDDSVSYKFHAILHSKVGGNIYQGFGLTEDEAMRDAIIRSVDTRRKELEELDILQNVIWGDHELYK